MSVVIITGASRSFPQALHNTKFCALFWLIPVCLRRGIGLVATSFLLEKFKATVIAISRTRSSELNALAGAHPETLQIVECDMPVLVAFSVPSRSLMTHPEPMNSHSPRPCNPCLSSTDA
jgi:hypothetical protein